MKKAVKIGIITVATVMAGAMCLSGCGKTSSSGSSSGSAATNKYGTQYPLKTSSDDKLKMWTIFSVQNDYNSYQDMPFYQEAQKRTGVKLDIQGPTGGQFAESFNLMIASGDLPDIIMYDWGDAKVAGGPEKYVKENYIIHLNDAIKNYAPNLSKLLKENPDIDKAVKTDEGNYYVFPNFSTEEQAAYAGPVVRQDWLDDLGMSVPETIDDWHTMLTRFKNEKGSTAPLDYIDWLFQDTGFISSAYGEKFGYYIDDDGKIEYGPANPGWKEFLTTMRQWYSEGLIDSDIASLDASTKDSKIMSGKCGAFLGSGGDMGTYIPGMKSIDPKAKFVGVQYPVLKKGDKPKFGIYQNKYSGLMSSAISADCKNVELAAKFLDYFFTDEGKLFANFGIEGKTYKMVNGYPTLTDEILNSKDINNEISKYAIAQFSVIDPRYYDQRMKFDEQKSAIKLWAETDAKKHTFPVLLPTTEESSASAKYTTDIKTYANEMYIKYMIGSESFDTYDNYLKKLNDIGLQDVLKMYQAEYDRYKKR